MKNIGIFGGTFNPIHFGHLRGALEVYEHFALDTVLFVPSYIPPHKSGEEIIPPATRLEMTRIALEPFEGFEVCELEIKRGKVSYSHDTVRALKETSPDDRFSFIVGTDAFFELGTWKNYEEFIFLCDFIVMTRPGAPVKDIWYFFPEKICSRFRHDTENRLYESDAGTRIHFHEITKLDISSTVIRSLCRNRRSIKYLLPERVEEYITKNNLYS